MAQIGPVTQNLDPVYQGTYGAGHQTQPQANPFLSGVEALIDNRRIYNNSLSQGFLTGGSLTLAFNNGYLNENAPTNDLNPSSAPALSLSLLTESFERVRRRGEFPDDSCCQAKRKGFRFAVSILR